MADTLPAEPVKGTVWTHSKRINYSGQAIQYTVTSVQTRKMRDGSEQRVVYSRDSYYDKIKTPLRLFKSCDDGGFVKSIDSIPEATSGSTGPKLTPCECGELFRKADAAGRVAADACVPVPMVVVVEHANAFDDASPVVRQYAPVTGGVCGFAWITVRPGNSAFARYLAKSHGARTGYYGGTQHWVSAYGQSMERKQAYAHAFASVLNDAGIKAYSESRMD